MMSYTLVGLGLTAITMLWAMLAAGIVRQQNIDRFRPVFVLTPLLLYAVAIAALILGWGEWRHGWIVTVSAAIFLSVFAVGGLLATARQDGTVTIRKGTWVYWVMNKALALPIDNKKFSICGLSWAIVPMVVAMLIMALLYTFLSVVFYLVLIAIVVILWLVTGKSPVSYADEIMGGKSLWEWWPLSSDWDLPEFEVRKVAGVSLSPVFWAITYVVVHQFASWTSALFAAGLGSVAVVMCVAALAAALYLIACPTKCRRYAYIEQRCRYDHYTTLDKLGEDKYRALCALGVAEIPHCTAERIFDGIGSAITALLPAARHAPTRSPEESAPQVAAPMVPTTERTPVSSNAQQAPAAPNKILRGLGKAVAWAWRRFWAALGWLLEAALTVIGFIGRGIWWPGAIALHGLRIALDELIILVKTIKGKTCLVVKVED